MTKTTIKIGDAILNQRTVAGTIASALRTHTLTPTPATFAEVETAVWHVLSASERASANAVADRLCQDASSVVYRAAEGDAAEALDRALGL